MIKYSPNSDHRGTFTRFYCFEEIQKGVGIDTKISQINHSFTQGSGVVRGLHYQKIPFAETKIITCLHGKVFDVIVDIRRESATFLKWFGVELIHTDGQAVLIPEGFAHGFQTLTSNVQLLYMHSAPYSPKHERGIRYNDPFISINWPRAVKDVSQKDRNHPLISDKHEVES